MRSAFPLLLCLIAFVATLDAAQIEVITTKSDVFESKETDWIYGDYLLQNDLLMAVVAQPKPGRHANLTVRSVGGGVIDLTLKSRPNDQLSCYFPTAGKFKFEDDSLVRLGATANSEVADQKVSGKSVFIEIDASSGPSDNLNATIRYELRDGETFLRASVHVQAKEDAQVEIPARDGIRADGSFRFGKLSESDAYTSDSFFGQTYGLVSPNASGQLSWKGGRMRILEYGEHATNQESPSQLDWSVYLVPATSVTDLAATIDQIRSPGLELNSHTLQLTDAVGPVGRARITLDSESEFPAEAIRTRDDGTATLRLPNGEYKVSVIADGYVATNHSLSLSSRETSHSIKLPTPASVVAEITGVDGNTIPCKVTFYGMEGTKNPNFGPESASGSILNCVYSVAGKFRRPIDPGKYEVVISYGPEFDTVVQSIEVVRGKATPITATLKRTVQTPGWVSAELHSHATPSGDNTATQRGRVENLLCEHLEFAPCTEHNRIDSYTPHLKHFGVEHLMATCTGMELTGSPLPVNHQNAFPLHHHPHTQDGGGPTTDADPVVQIERLAMWDNGSEKVVQGNHPNIRQQFGDRDNDGKTDDGFRKMFGYMDVIEIHPPAAIFDVFDQPEAIGKNRMAHWIQLLNQGIRVPGVVNTDAHYNHHGSGWLRNWFESSTDDPAEISIDEMIHAAEHGHIIMSTGPFMTVDVVTQNSGKPIQGVPGDDLVSDSGTCQVSIHIQCPNWLDVNRVQIFLNGRSTEKLNFTRRDHPSMFSNDVTKFKQTIPVDIKEDTHIIVATIGEDLKLGKVMGERYGKLAPCAVSNPVWVDVDGNGFKPNMDGLGKPLPGAGS